LIPPYENKELADKILEDWDDTCKSRNIPHFVFLGTCLGFYRDKGYIPTDTDLDVGVLCNSHEFEELVKALIQKGILHGGGLTHNINMGRKSVLLDIWHTFGPLHQSFLQKFDTVAYNGRNYNTPSPIEKYLEFAYGNWKIPVTLGKPNLNSVKYQQKGGPLLL